MVPWPSRVSALRRKSAGHAGRDATLLAQLVRKELHGTSLEDWGSFQPWRRATRQLIERRRPRWFDAPGRTRWFAQTLWNSWEVLALAEQMLDEIAEAPEQLDVDAWPPSEAMRRLARVVLDAADLAEDARLTGTSP